ncbi:hypothetical protein A5893_08195 [Pedobacter psychrophilus]|uniref:Uncharacterized protein n=2 Tax=Pedobacter psychrophilus TaxID=1826909 RepID=A0A179DES2_9SPHI|nr:hypothetical protein A5893_08195 [Pedobacter psychrophilus]
MGDLEAKAAMVNLNEITNSYDILLPDDHQISIKFSENGELVQTVGTPLDSNTLHSISEAIKNHNQ